MSKMDGIPSSIWRDFPHPEGPSLGGREHIPFTDFEVILARQILSCSLDKQRSKQAILGATEASKWRNFNLERVDDEQRDRHYMWGRACNYEAIVGILGHKRLEMNDAFVDLADDDASTESLESETVQVHNPSLFSHRATVEDLIASFRRDSIGPLAGVDMREDTSTDSNSAPIIVISDAVCPKSLDCALEKWRVEQEEKELEMRWRATKRVSENWLTKVELMRQRHRARIEKLEREREMKKKKVGGGTSGSLTVKEAITPQGNTRTTTTSQLHSSNVPPPAAAPQSNAGPSQLTPTVWHPSSSAPRSTNDPASAQVPGFGTMPSSALVPYPTANPETSRGAVSQGHAPSTNPRLPHAHYDPRTPDLALEDLAHLSLDSTQLSPLILPERFLDIEVPAGVGNLTAEESILTQQGMVQDHVHPYIDEAEEVKWQDCVQQYFDVAKMQMSSSPVMHPSASSSQDAMPLISLPPSTHTTLPTTTPDIAEDDSGYFVQQPPLPQALQDGLLPPSTAPRSPRSLAFDRWLLNNIYDMGPSEFQAGPVPHMDVELPDGQYAGTAGNSYLGVDPTATQELSDIASGQNMAPAEPSAEEKAMWHAWSLSQAPPDTAAEIIMRNIQASSASTVVPTGINLAPIFTGSNDDAARLKMLVGFPPVLEQQVRMVTDWAWSWVPYTTVPLNKANSSLMMAPRAVLVDPTYSTLYSPIYSPTHRNVNNEAISQDQSVAPVSLSVPVSRPVPVLKTYDLPSSLRSSHSHVDSPMSPSSPHTATTGLFTESGDSSSSPLVQYSQCLPLGDRLFRIARVANVDVLRPSYWFEPDIMVTERMRDVVDLMERSGGWKCSERRMRMFDGVRTPRGPDDLGPDDFASF